MHGLLGYYLKLRGVTTSKTLNFRRASNCQFSHVCDRDVDIKLEGVQGYGYFTRMRGCMGCIVGIEGFNI